MRRRSAEAPTHPQVTPLGGTSLDGGSGAEPMRRLQRMGAVTIGVSLPRAWVGERGLAPGSPVILRPLPDGSILLKDSSESLAPARSVIVVRAGMPPEHLFRQLVGAYLAGAVEFVLHEPAGISPETRSVARTFARRTVQPEIVTEEPATLVLRDVSLGSRLPLPQLLRRMFQLVVDLQSEAVRSFEHATEGRDIQLGPRDDEVDRHAWLIERILTMRIATDASGELLRSPLDDPVQVLLLVRSLERIADHAVSIAEHGSHFAQLAPSKRIVNALTRHHQQVLDHLRAAYALAERPDASQANEVIDAGEALHATHRTLLENLVGYVSGSPLPPTGVVALGLILQSIDRTTAYADDIAEGALDRATRSEIQRDPVPPRTDDRTLSSSLTTKRGGKRNG